MTIFWIITLLSGIEATDLGFVCFVVINHCVLSANRVDYGFFLFHKYLIYLFPSQHIMSLLPSER